MRIGIISYAVTFNFIITSAFRQDSCEKCVQSENCPQFLNMDREQQQRWLSQFSCQQEDSSFYGFTPGARGNYVCCPGTNVWSIVNDEPERGIKLPFDQFGVNRPTQRIPNANIFPPYGGQNFNPIETPKYGYTQRPGGRRIDFDGGSPDLGSQYPNYLQPSQPGYNDQNLNKGFYPGTNKPQYFVPKGQLPNNQYPPCSNTQFGNLGQNPNCNYYQPGFNGKNNMNNMFPTQPTPPPYQPTQVYPGFNTLPTRPPQNMFPPNFPGGNGGMNFGNQCQVPNSLPPDPETGCCGLDMSGTEGMTDLKNIVTQRLRNPMFLQNNIRLKRETENGTVEIELDNRIAGGSETELNQFPWTVLLKITFDYGKNKTTFNCGGSILSSRYILTAAHCIHEKDARLSEIEIFLAEYDKRTFPRDCKLNFGGERTCIDNVMMFAENIIRHPEYDDKKLFADIALIRLHGNAPYTEFIRPICLPPVNVDNQAFYGLPLPVAGWGRNGPYMSDIKQSTVVNLVPHDECQRYYPYLSPSHLCAAGKTGEDTCKGDSGGPLMMLYGGKYYVIGIVSGKRADAPCGTAVPSLYTNVFQYLQWIRNNIN
ncbi:unnamed protein product, partial [Iphiclides podalirius]